MRKIDEVVEHFHQLGRHVWHLASNDVGVTSSNEVTIVVEDQGRALVFDIGWDAEVGVHANIRAISQEEYVTPMVLGLDDAVLITAR